MDEEVELELQALQAVYGDECRVLQRWPPHVEILLKPRTAEELSQQFVEIVLAIQASEQYPEKPPKVELSVVKGLDAARQMSLVLQLKAEARQLSNEPMLVILSESAVEFLTLNNYPEGDCCFCLLPLAEEDLSKQRFMKLMSCFHCFHSDCFSSWWNWIPKDGSVICPICRSEIQPQDVAHVPQTCSKPGPGLPEVENEEERRDLHNLLQNEAGRQAQFVQIFEEQKARDGIFEHRELRLGSLNIIPSEQPPRPASATTETQSPSMSRRLLPKAPKQRQKKRQSNKNPRKQYL